MMILLSVILIINLIFIGVYLYIFLKSNNSFNEKIENNKKYIDKLSNELDMIKNEIITLNDNPRQINNRISLLDSRINKMENILSTFNNGFSYKESWMR